MYAHSQEYKDCRDELATVSAAPMATLCEGRGRKGIRVELDHRGVDLSLLLISTQLQDNMKRTFWATTCFGPAEFLPWNEQAIFSYVFDWKAPTDRQGDWTY